MPDEIHWLADPVRTPSGAHAAEARRHQDSLTKPPGALGVLETLVVTLAGLQHRAMPRADTVPVLVFAGDHGITAQGVSAYPSAVTVEMLANFVSGGAAIAVLARELGLKLTVIDAGTLAKAPAAGVITDKPRSGTSDFSAGAAMREVELAHALAAGRRAFGRAAPAAELLVLGEMGIGNTTAAAAIAAALLGTDAAAVTGAGTGLDQGGIAHKSRVIDRALALHGLVDGQAAPITVLARVGGFEIAALTGAMIAAAQAGVPVLVDGFIVSVAALAACRIVPGVRDWLIFSHTSAEAGHARVLEALGAEPVVSLGLRLGEGSGAALVLPLVRLACALHGGMATFAAAGVSGPGKG